MNNHIIEINDLHKKFGEVHALQGVSLQVKRGEIYGFIGKNGAGKSTTMNIMAGLSRPHSGSCIVNGREITTVKHPGQLSIGYLPEAPTFYGWMTARESLEYLKHNGKRRVQPSIVVTDGTSDQAFAGIDEMLSWVGLADVADRRIGGFSRGMKQRLGLCQILMHEPELLILDEPSSALDSEGRSDILRLIRELNQMGKTIIFSTHILSDVERICHTVGMIAGGRMIMEKPLSEMLRQDIGPIFEIELARQLDEDTIRNLRENAAIEKISERDNDYLSVMVRDEDTGSMAIVNWAATNNLPLRGFTLRQVNLEELFIQEVNGSNGSDRSHASKATRPELIGGQTK